MSITLATEPIKDISGVVSSVNASLAQIPFTFTTVPAGVNQKLNIKVVDIADAPLVDLTFRYAPAPDDTIFVDMSQVLQELHLRIPTNSIEFKIEYWETYDGFDGSHLFSGVIQSIYAKQSIRTIGGANMWEFLPNNPRLGFSLTQFTKPIWWADFKRTLGVIIDSRIVARIGQIRFKGQYLDINKVYISDSASVEIPTTVTTFAVDIESGTVQANRVVFNAPTGAKYIRAFFETIAGSLEVTNPLDFELQPECKNPILLEWTNSFGEVDQHLFNINQTVQIESKQGLIFEVSVDEDIEFVNGTKGRISTTSTQQVILTAEDLTRDQLEALIDIKASALVRVLTNQIGTQFITVIVVNNYTTQYNTDDGLHSFQVTIEMPNNLDIFSLLTYDLVQEIAPENLQITQVPTTIDYRNTLTWDSKSGGFETGFGIERSTDNVNFAQVGTVLTGVETYDDIFTPTEAVYYYRVNALGGLPSDYSNSATANISPFYFSWIAAMTAPTTLEQNSILVYMVNNSANVALMDEFYLLTLGATNSLIGMKGKTATNNGATFDINGATFGGTQWIDTDFNPSTDGVKYLLDDMIAGAFVKQFTPVGANEMLFGAFNSNPENTSIYSNSANTVTYSTNASVRTVATETISANTLYAASFVSPNIKALFIDGLSKDEVIGAAVTAIPLVTFNIGRRNGGTAFNFNGILSTFVVGGGTGVNHADENTHLRQLLTDLGTI